MDAARIAVESELTPSDYELAWDGLIAFNKAAAGQLGYSDVFVSLREEGELRGACLGKIYWHWLCLDLLWVAEGFRHRGYGKDLLGKAEDEGRSRGCVNVLLDTFSFQAPEFYRRLGYIEFGRLPGFPDGHARIYLTKKL
jgi:GNAT superfamily N-acetyltransferase